MSVYARNVLTVGAEAVTAAAHAEGAKMEAAAAQVAFVKSQPNATLARPALAPTLAPHNKTVHNTSGPNANVLHTLLNQLKAQEDDTTKLETQVTSIHSRLVHAEAFVARFTKQITTVRTHLFGTDERVRDTTWKLRNLTRRVADINSTMEIVQFKAQRAQPEAKTITHAASKQANASEDMASDDEVKRVQDISDKAWKLTDPNQADSLDASELRLTAMHKEIANFTAFLGTEVKDVLQRRLYRKTNQVRAALRGLGATALNPDA